MDGLHHFTGFDGFRYIGVYPCLQTALAITAHRMRGHGYDGNVPARGAPKMQESGSCSDLGGLPESHQPRWSIAGTANAVRVGLWRHAHQRRDAAAFHGLPAAAHGAGNMRKLPAKPNRGGRPPGPRMLCGWHCGAKFTATKCGRTSLNGRAGRRLPREACSCKGLARARHCAGRGWSGSVSVRIGPA
jgi:hypothetical protein